MSDKVSLLNAIRNARRYLDRDPGMSAFMVRDFDEAIELGMNDLLVLLSKDDGIAHRNDVEPLLDQLEEAYK